MRGGKIGLFGGAGVGKTVRIMELLNNVAMGHGARCWRCDLVPFVDVCDVHIVNVIPTGSILCELPGA